MTSDELKALAEEIVIKRLGSLPTKVFYSDVVKLSEDLAQAFEHVQREMSWSEAWEDCYRYLRDDIKIKPNEPQYSAPCDGMTEIVPHIFVPNLTIERNRAHAAASPGCPMFVWHECLKCGWRGE